MKSIFQAVALHSTFVPILARRLTSQPTSS